MRAVIEHGLDRGPLPVKLCYAGPFFRYERPQAGRYRQLQQVGVEAIGVDDPALDAEVIAVADAGFRSLGLDGFRLEITSLGDDSCRPQYRELLQDFLFRLDLDDETRRRAEINPLRVLDDKRPHVARDDGRRPGDARSPLRRRQAALRHRACAPRRARRAVRDQPADGARAGLLHQDDVRVRPRRARCAVRHRRWRPLRRADATARWKGPVGHRVWARRRPHPAGTQGGGQDGRRRGPCRRVRRTARRSGQAAALGAGGSACARRGCGSTSPTATAG